MDEIDFDTEGMFGQCRLLDDRLMECYVDGLAQGDPLYKINVILKDCAGMSLCCTLTVNSTAPALVNFTIQRCVAYVYPSRVCHIPLYNLLGNKPMCIGGQHITKSCRVQRNYLLDTRVPLHRIPPHLQTVFATIFASDTPIHMLMEALECINVSNTKFPKAGMLPLSTSSSGGLGGKTSPGKAFTSVHMRCLQL